jgi:hypothetical protein
VANTLGHTIAVINVKEDANTLAKTMSVGGLATDVKVAGRWGIVSGHETNSALNQPETGHGLPKIVNGVAVRNDGSPLVRGAERVGDTRWRRSCPWPSRRRSRPD